VNTRGLTEDELRGQEVLRKLGHEHALLFLTRNGLEKSILDAVFPVRQVLRSGRVHDFNTQLQGPDAKRIVQGLWIQDDRIVPLDVSLYRPVTKQGDPRLWPSGLKALARPDDVVAVFVVRGQVHLWNLSLHPILKADAQVLRDEVQRPDLLDRPIAPLTPMGLRQRTEPKQAELVNPAPLQHEVRRYLQSTRVGISAAAATLLQLLRQLASQPPLRAVCKGPTAIGRTIETALGININSARQPDFHGIELKSARSHSKGKGTRLTLFACVPDWSVSACKSSAEILARFGYDSAGARRLYCEVSTTRVNSQGLYFEMDMGSEVLIERHLPSQRSAVATWPLARLSSYLTSKHGETFWIKARSVKHNGVEQFQLETVEHTQAPSFVAFCNLLAQDTITMDHLIKQANRKTTEKGPLFKIERDSLANLFPSGVRQYRLT
jgi:hypothetical protein